MIFHNQIGSETCTQSATATVLSPLRLPTQAIILSKTSGMVPRTSLQGLQHHRKNTTAILNNFYTKLITKYNIRKLNYFLFGLGIKYNSRDQFGIKRGVSDRWTIKTEKGTE